MLYWTEPAATQPPCSLAKVQLLLALTRLFNQLYDRNTRRAFAPSEHWHWPSVAVREIEQADVQKRNDGDGQAAVITFVGTDRLALVLTCIPQVKSARVPRTAKTADPSNSCCARRRLFPSRSVSPCSTACSPPTSCKLRARSTGTPTRSACAFDVTIFSRTHMRC